MNKLKVITSVSVVSASDTDTVTDTHFIRGAGATEVTTYASGILINR